MNMFDRIGPFKKASLNLAPVVETGNPVNRAFDAIQWAPYVFASAMNLREFTVAGIFSHATEWLPTGYVNCVGGTLEPMRAFNPQGKRVMIEVDYSAESQMADVSFGLVVGFMQNPQYGPGWDSDNDMRTANIIDVAEAAGRSDTFQVLLEHADGAFPDADLDKAICVAVYCHNAGSNITTSKQKIKISAKYCLVGTECLDLTK